MASTSLYEHSRLVAGSLFREAVVPVDGVAVALQMAVAA